MTSLKTDALSPWDRLWQEAELACTQEPLLIPLIESVITSSRSLPEAMGRLLTQRVACAHMPLDVTQKLFAEFTENNLQTLNRVMARDLMAIMKNDPAAKNMLWPFLYFKGFHGIQLYRLSHYFWHRNKRGVALFLQSRNAEIFGMDIHPAALLGEGIMMDHATGIVIGETAVVEDDVLFWHNVTLGGKSLLDEDRHPKIRRGAMLGAHATIIGNIEIGIGARIGAGSVVVKDVPDGATVVGPASKIL